MAESAINTGRVRGVLVGRGDSDRVWDLLGVKEELGRTERLMERLRVGVSVGVCVMEGGIPMVPAKL
jgi:hypothetical protein